MKTVLISIISAVIGGMILFGLQHGWSAWQDSGRQLIEVESAGNSWTASKSDLLALAKPLGENGVDTVNVMMVTVKNTGSGDISNQSFSSSDSNITRWGSVELPNDNPKNADISYDGKVMTVRYRYLPAGSHHRFWVARSFPASGALTFTADAPGIQVNSNPDHADDFPWWLVWASLIMFLAFLAGVSLGDSSLAKLLKKQGVDVDALRKSATTPVAPTVQP